MNNLNTKDREMLTQLANFAKRNEVDMAKTTLPELAATYFETLKWSELGKIEIRKIQYHLKQLGLL